jgi:hypothetical protein
VILNQVAQPINVQDGTMGPRAGRTPGVIRDSQRHRHSSHGKVHHKLRKCQQALEHVQGKYGKAIGEAKRRKVASKPGRKSHGTKDAKVGKSQTDPSNSPSPSDVVTPEQIKQEEELFAKMPATLPPIVRSDVPDRWLWEEEQDEKLDEGVIEDWKEIKKHFGLAAADQGIDHLGEWLSEGLERNIANLKTITLEVFKEALTRTDLPIAQAGAQWVRYKRLVGLLSRLRDFIEHNHLDKFVKGVGLAVMGIDMDLEINHLLEAVYDLILTIEDHDFTDRALAYRITEILMHSVAAVCAIFVFIFALLSLPLDLFVWILGVTAGGVALTVEAIWDRRKNHPLTAMEELVKQSTPRNSKDIMQAAHAILHGARP